jgi:YbbR domain-containing protein
MEKLAKQILKYYTNPRKWSWPNNWGLKLLSLLFAIFLWYFVVGEDKVDLKVFVPIEIVNLPRNLVISNEYKKQLEVTIRGPRVLTKGLDQQRISRSIDLSKATPGKFVFDNKDDSIPFPRGIKVLRIQPKNFTLFLDQLIQKELAINAVVKGKPKEGFELVNVLLEPATISVTGPQTVLEKETVVSTVPIDIENIQSTTEKEVTLDLNEEIAELIGEPVITAKILLKEKTTERNIKQISVGFTQSADGSSYYLVPSSVDVRAEIPISMINNKVDLKPLFIARINAESLPPGRHVLNVEVTPPKQIRILEITPKSVTIKISRKKSIKKPAPAQ